MAVTLEWIRDNYDTIIRDRYIDSDEHWKAMQDRISNLITAEQQEAVQTAYHSHTLLPDYDTPTPPPSKVTLEWIRDNYDANKDRYIDVSENWKAAQDHNSGSITAEQQQAIQTAYANHTLLPDYGTPTPVCTPGAKRCRDANTVEQCRVDGSGWDVVQTCGSGFECKNGSCVSVSPTPPPNMETRTVSLTEGQHTIQVSFTGYDTLNATINVSSTGVTCVSVIGGACGGSSLPRVSTSGWTVTTYLKEGAVTSDVCAWINSIGGWRNLQWTSHVLEAYYVYIGAGGHSVGFSPVTWNDVLGLYYYYINDPTAGNGKIGCGT